MLANTCNRSHICKGCLFLSVTALIVTTPGLIVALIGEAHSEGKSTQSNTHLQNRTQNIKGIA
jgi:hypothetical protein